MMLQDDHLRDWCDRPNDRPNEPHLQWQQSAHKPPSDMHPTRKAVCTILLYTLTLPDATASSLRTTPRYGCSHLCGE